MSSCICDALKPVETQSCFVILMHQKEFQKTKNTTGRMTHLSLPHSHLFIGIDFSEHRALNLLLNDPQYTPFILFPDKKASNLSSSALALNKDTKALFILIDSTWGCANKIMALSSNLHNLPRVSFSVTQESNYQIKKQPQSYCLSTIETTQSILKLLNDQKIETLQNQEIEALLNPFKKMIAYQLAIAKSQKKLRYKISAKSDNKAI